MMIFCPGVPTVRVLNENRALPAVETNLSTLTPRPACERQSQSTKGDCVKANWKVYEFAIVRRINCIVIKKYWAWAHCVILRHTERNLSFLLIVGFSKQCNIFEVQLISYAA